MNKVAFITGGTRGIGKQIAITLANEGYDIAINYRQENKELEETRNEIKKNNVKCLAVKGNIAKFEDTKSMVTKIIEEFGKIDILVNNAGITKDMLLMRMIIWDFSCRIREVMFGLTEWLLPKSAKILNLLISLLIIS